MTNSLDKNDPKVLEDDEIQDDGDDVILDAVRVMALEALLGIEYDEDLVSECLNVALSHHGDDREAKDLLEVTEDVFISVLAELSANLIDGMANKEISEKYISYIESADEAED